MTEKNIATKRQRQSDRMKRRKSKRKRKIEKDRW